MKSVERMFRISYFISGSRSNWRKNKIEGTEDRTKDEIEGSVSDTVMKLRSRIGRGLFTLVASHVKVI